MVTRLGNYVNYWNGWMNEFEKWLFEVPWRFERYCDMIPEYPMSEEEKDKLRKFWCDNV